MSKPQYPDKPLSKFREGGIVGNIKAKVVSVTEKFRTRDTEKGKEGSFYKTAVVLEDDSGTMGIGFWIPAADLPFKRGDLISINEVRSDSYNDVWEIKSCSRSKVVVHAQEKEEFYMKNEDHVRDNHANLKDTQTVDMPFNPEAVTKSQGEFTTVLLEQILTATLRVGDLLEAMMKK